jgi:KDO2-lipid IV(A) lauroyltransferase
VLFASHNFNWEWLLAGGSIHLPAPVDFVYQPQNSELFNRFSLVSRTRFGGYPIQRHEVAKESFRRRHILRGIAIVADQYPGHTRDKKYITEFLHQETAFFYGAAQLAASMQYPVMYGEIRKVERGFYVCKLVSISEPPYSGGPGPIIENYARALEKLINERPSEWLWSHNRWKKRHLKKF